MPNIVLVDGRKKELKERKEEKCWKAHSDVKAKRRIERSWACVRIYIFIHSRNIYRESRHGLQKKRRRRRRKHTKKRKKIKTQHERLLNRGKTTETSRENEFVFEEKKKKYKNTKLSFQRRISAEHDWLRQSWKSKYLALSLLMMIVGYWLEPRVFSTASN